MNRDRDISVCDGNGAGGNSVSRTRFSIAICVWLVALFGAAWMHAAASEPQSVAQLTVLQARLKLVVTMTSDAAQDLLAHANLPADVAQSLTPIPPQLPCDLPEQTASQIFEVTANGNSLTPEKVSVSTEDKNVLFTIIYPRPESGVLTAKAIYLNDSEQNNSFVARDENQDLLSAALLSRNNNSVRLQLPSLDSATTKWPQPEEPSDALGDDEMDAPAAAPVPAPAPVVAAPTPSLGDYFRLGLQHLLTELEHVVFLGLLLIGARRILPMLGVIACFTVAQSITLALATTELYTLPAAWIKPLIILSIVAVAADNVLRRDAVADRFWLAIGFGFVHGFDFARGLHQSTSGSPTAMPLFSYNAGLTLGQVALAAVAIAVFVMLRRVPAIVRIRSMQ